MRYQLSSLQAADGCQLSVHSWHPEGEPRVLLQVVHGLAEHARRYTELAAALCHAGHAVHALDLRGHGLSAAQGLRGHFADHEGWQKLVDDQRQLNHLLRREHPLTPIVLLGHDLGSHVAQSYLLSHSCSVSAAILCAPCYQPPWSCRLVRLLVRMETLRLGERGRSALLDWLSFGRLNLAFHPARSRCDWLSSDPVAVESYLTDPDCGFRCTNRLWLDLLEGLSDQASLQALARIDAGLPLLLLGGSHDALCVERLAELAVLLRQAGLSRVELRLYPGARHALFAERNRAEVFHDLLHWLDGLPGHKFESTP